MLFATKAIASRPLGHCLGSPGNAETVENYSYRCALPRRKCLGALTLSKNEADRLGFLLNSLMKLSPDCQRGNTWLLWVYTQSVNTVNTCACHLHVKNTCMTALSITHTLYGLLRLPTPYALCWQPPLIHALELLRDNAKLIILFIQNCLL